MRPCLTSYVDCETKTCPKCILKIDTHFNFCAVLSFSNNLATSEREVNIIMSYDIIARYALYSYFPVSLHFVSFNTKERNVKNLTPA
jgi:hypothetical protein